MFLEFVSSAVLAVIALICFWVVCNNKKFKFRTIEILILVWIGTAAFSAFLILLRLDSILIYLKIIRDFGVGK